MHAKANQKARCRIMDMGEYLLSLKAGIDARTLYCGSRLDLSPIERMQFRVRSSEGVPLPPPVRSAPPRRETRLPCRAHRIMKPLPPLLKPLLLLRIVL